MPIFSVIIPHRNCPELLKRCIESVPESEDIEIILVDDNSDDKQLLYDCLKKIERSNFFVIESTKGGWAGGSRNIGLDKAKGDWILFLDADDYFLPEAFAQFCKYATTDNDIIYFKHQSVYSDTLQPCDRFPYRNRIIQSYLELPTIKNREEVMFGDVVPWGKMIRRSLIKDNNIKYDEIPCCEDVMFISRCAAKTKQIEVSERIVYCLTYRSSSLTMAYSKDKDWIGYSVSLQRNEMLKSINSKYHRIRLLSFIWQALRRYGVKESVKYISEAHSAGHSIFEGLFFSPAELKDRLVALFQKDSFQG